MTLSKKKTIFALIMIGVYKVTNLQTNKYYIGSSKDILKREKYHFSRLKNNKHFNKHLQNSFNKYGVDSFTFEIIKEMSNFNKNELLKLEQHYIDIEKESNLYNLTLITNSGGSDILSIPVYLLDLSGKIINKFESISEASRKINCKINKQLNSKSIIKSSYRLVTCDFYYENQNIINSWKKFSSIRDFEIENIKNKRIILLEKDGEIIEFKDRVELSKYLNITKQAISKALKNKKYLKFKYPELNIE